MVTVDRLSLKELQHAGFSRISGKQRRPPGSDSGLIDGWGTLLNGITHCYASHFTLMLTGDPKLMFVLKWSLPFCVHLQSRSQCQQGISCFILRRNTLLYDLTYSLPFSVPSLPALPSSLLPCLSLSLPFMPLQNDFPILIQS